MQGEPQTEQCNYLRINRNTRSAAVDQFAATGDWRRFVLTATAMDKSPSLLDAFTARGRCEITLDTETAEAAAPAFAVKYCGKFPWMPKARALLPNDMTEGMIDAHSIAVAQFVAKHHIDVVLSPSHLLGEHGEPWLQIDADSCIALRAALIGAGLSHIAIDYALLAPMARLSDPNWRAQVCHRLAPLPFRQRWLRAGPFGIGCGRYFGDLAAALADFREKLKRPIVLDHAGGIAGMVPAIFGYADAVCHGVGSKLASDFKDWNTQSPFSGSSAGGIANIYVPVLDRMVYASDYRALTQLKAPQRRAFSCVSTQCCASDQDVFDNREAHFLRQVSAVQRELLTVDSAEGQRCLHKRLWEGERIIRSSLRSLGDAPGHIILSESLANVEHLRQTIPLAGSGMGERLPVAFNGREPSERHLILRETRAPHPRRQPVPGPDLFEDFPLTE